MRAVVQRVSHSSVRVEDNLISEINQGLLVLLGVGKNDTDEDINYLVEKILNLRIFNDEDGKLNLSLLDIQGQIQVVSQFTLFADCRKGRRPSYIEAAPPEAAKVLYQKFVEVLLAKGLQVATGQFQAHMEVSLINDGPVTILLDSKKNF
jgi:D-aminoacyl-tRNA deacylase